MVGTYKNSTSHTVNLKLAFFVIREDNNQGRFHVVIKIVMVSG